MAHFERFARGSPLYGEGGGDPRERALRSIFIANIAFETTEEELKGVLSQVGPVVHFRMVYDQHSGRPKGFAFCEYQDVETAQSALRNLHEQMLNGRPLKLDSAANAPDDRFKGPPPPPGRPPIEPRIYGPPVPPQAAPEEITKAVASLPPEQMFELMKQMQVCIKNNAEEARQLLLQNPQLAYALLQAQVIMRLIDSGVAQEMLHRSGSSRMDQAPPPPSSSRPPPGPSDVHKDLPPPPPPHTQPPGGSQSVPSSSKGHPAPTPLLQPVKQQPPSGPSRAPPAPPPAPQPSSSTPQTDDEEKEQLIKQVLSLSDEQVALLPPDQRESIIQLREQLKKQAMAGL